MDRKLFLAQPRLASIPDHVHGVSRRCENARPLDKEGSSGATENGGQLPQDEFAIRNIVFEAIELRSNVAKREKKGMREHIIRCAGVEQ